MKKTRKPQDPETVIRVKLPSSNAYPSCPSGDTDYEVDYAAAIRAALPEGWKVVTMRSNYRPPTDSDGKTLLFVERVEDQGR